MDPIRTPSVRDVERTELKFLKLAEELRRDILAGTWPIGAKLPTEQQLMTDKGLSLTTVRRAFDELVHQELVVRRRGAGTFVAERLRSGRTRFIVGVLIPDTQLYYGRVLQGLEEHLSQVGARLQLATYNYDPAREDSAIAALIADGVDGLVLVPTFGSAAQTEARVAELDSLGVPVLLLERRPLGAGPADRTEHVVSDHAGGAFDAITHLVSLGHRRIALMVRTGVPTSDGVLEGYAAAARSHDLTPLQRSHPKGQWTPAAVEEAAGWLVDNDATATLVFGDREATLVQGALRRRGLRIPEDVAMVSYDDEMAELAEIPLTAVAPAKHRLGRLAAQTILRRLVEGDASPIQQVRLRPRLVVRDSCGAKAATASGTVNGAEA